MCDLTRNLPIAEVCHLGPHDLFVELHRGDRTRQRHKNSPPLLFIHGAFTGSWMWAKYVPHFIEHGIDALYLNLRGHFRSRSVDLSRVTFADYVAAVRELNVFVGSEFEVSQTVSDGKTVFSSMVLNASGNLFIFAERGKRAVSAVTLDLNRMNPTPRETANPVDQ